MYILQWSKAGQTLTEKLADQYAARQRFREVIGDWSVEWAIIRSAESDRVVASMSWNLWV